ncbi:3-oxoacyl-[acyl-carrier-protein] reductase [Liquorilactobacillus satsumensis]|uniref:3-oxoacyl-[acyl-carrier-protein] reductase n=1 Tax=Liquorilactobacillus satsumensis DSM 16230 = JCM 12392 TaxID=1423801 RepID=A0A0R1V2R3_9LACO|nr:3-oxoacyl-[acyl-carrier-protein] reductase [Liquorilactobacillus satsumensis]KRL97512.1 3-oxoacyl-[acyl-carrier-protein] reductase [Liquorilactobacillus satsumensis DSM 16230 = JCM 12392]MCC7666722.1 3-oxoacyl-[acyl-carrier-protein] reductase [Liquorilactobacillus satsumensis]MCP9312659.1 3-oxoacyl-[acyl-carrier-protein] reductase [Liquorilactobacillus satsumensis]MCP9327562.1 3-oxoacyl-[acyl-carrier-protein] reductase [Liquorilactobacillus satsumensis]MCP9357598.1 3-oxoacyl-[acyl-carrier-p
MELKGKTVFITGSSRGIGAQIALAFAREGSKVILNARKQVPAELIAQIKGLGAECSVVLGDVSQSEDVVRMQKEIFQDNEKLDVLVNNAGITDDKLMIGMKEDDFRRVLETNLIGAFNLSQKILKKMYKKRSGVILNMASVVGLHGNIGQANYAASKAGLIGLTKTIAREGALRNVRCNAIAPGMIKSQMTAVLDEKVKEKVLQDIPLGRFGEAAEVAQAAVFLAQNDYVTGQVITVDGGMTI